MAKRRPDDFDLRAAIRSPSFTPAVADVAALLDMVCAEDDAEAERALERVGVAAGRAAIARLDGERGTARGRLARALGRVALATGDGALGEAVERLLDDEDAKTRRNAIIAVGKLGRANAEELLLAAWSRDERVDHRRSIAEALGRVGGERARALLDGLATDDAELRRIASRARSVIARNLSAAAPSGIDAESVPPRAFAYVARCRAGLAQLVADELAAFSPTVASESEVSFTSDKALSAPFVSRVLLDFGLALPVERGPAPEAIARALSSETARAALAAFARGTVRYRIEWASGGKRRAELFRAVEAIARASPSLVNDPSRRDWEVIARDRADAVEVLLLPRLDDPRFRWRAADVPASSHPTVAAALARLAGRVDGDVVWDPFVGAGAELIERARLGGCARLYGSDVDERALAAARANCDRAGVPVELSRQDALAPPPDHHVTLIVTNPPMGRRVQRNRELAPLLERFVAHAARALVKGGRMVWISPFAEKTARAAKEAGLRMDYQSAIDLGGFTGTIQKLRRP